MIAKCGKIRVWHWAHHGERHCDPWWEETAWHVAWKSRFPFDWQEVVQSGSDGELHIADVKLPDGRVLEFQHSPISEVERKSREGFYRSMIWVVDGLRRKRDRGAFMKTLQMTSRNPLVFSGFEDECALLRDWVGRGVDVVFDFGVRDEDVAEFGRSVLWHLYPDQEGRVMLSPMSTDAFVAGLHEGEMLRRVLRKPPLVIPPRPVPKPRLMESFQQHQRRMNRKRFRF